MNASKSLAFAFVLGFFAATPISSCGPTTSDECSAETCPDGCCDGSGQCQTATSVFQCGRGGVTCAPCAPSQQCIIGICTGSSGAGPGSGGGVGSSGGGSGSTGGGSGSTGGGSASTGGGSASTGGGFGSTGGGFGSTGGGFGSTGGGFGSTGGGFGSTGGGVGSTGGGFGSTGGGVGSIGGGVGSLGGGVGSLGGGVGSLGGGVGSLGGGVGSLGGGVGSTGGGVGSTGGGTGACPATAALSFSGGTAYASGSTVGQGHDVTFSCATFSPVLGADVIYSFTLGATSTVNVSGSFGSGYGGVGIVALGQCTTRTSSSADCTDPQYNTRSLTATLPAGSWGVAVQTYDDGTGTYPDDYSLTVTLSSSGTGGGSGSTGGGSGSTGGGSGTWVCNPSWQGSNDGCDCGCGAFDPDCATTNASSCTYCGSTSCGYTGSGSSCSAAINDTQNWHCN